MSNIKEDAVCRVWDKNAVHAERVHLVDGVNYSLSATGNGTEIPLTAGLKFLKDEAFKVVDHNGNRMRMKSADEPRHAITLPRHQTIANLDELSVPALVDRSKLLPGSEGVTKNWGKKRLVQFIMAGGVASDVETEKSFDQETEDLVEDDEDDEGDTDVADKALEHESFPEF